MNKTEPFSTPIIFIFFNRSEHIVETLSVLQKLKPSKLYLVADGPRNNKERKQIQKVRKLVEKNIIWKTKVTKIYAHKNMGLRNRIVSGLNNVFEKEETAIIMEDDCIADQSFFKFCDVLLKKYKNNKKIAEDLKGVAEVKHNDKVKSRFVTVDGSDMVFMTLDDTDVHPSYDLGVWIKTPYFTGAMDQMFDTLWKSK